jgi:UDPglucose 6-dehydrogenase
MKIAVVGSGYVGLVTGACFASLGNQVTCIDNDETKVRMLRRGKIPIFEPGLEEMVCENSKKGRLRFTGNIREGVKDSEIIFICVPTPPKESGEADLISVEKVSREVAQALNGYKVIVGKSTVPVETGHKIIQTIKQSWKKPAEFDIASNPEFLREGSAIYDFLNPDRIVVGVSSKRAEKLMRELYKPIKAPFIATDVKSAELIKHASNSFLAMKISFINAVAQVCEKVGADIEKVAEGMGLDQRIGRRFLDAGVGFGGSCFPKDVSAFLRIAEKLGTRHELLKDTLEINEAQKKHFVRTIEEALWNLTSKTLAVLGLAFKPNTDDMRSAPSIDIIQALQTQGAKIKAYDPQGVEKSKKIFRGVVYSKNPYEACRGADALVILTEWDEFKELDLKRVKKLLKYPVIFDGRNIFEPENMKKLGFRYYSIGRPKVE